MAETRGRKVNITYDFLVKGETNVQNAIKGVTAENKKLTAGVARASAKMPKLALDAGVPLTKLGSVLKANNITVYDSGKFVDILGGHYANMARVVSKIESNVVKATRAQKAFNSVSKVSGVPLGELNSQLSKAGISFNKTAGFTNKATQAKMKNISVVKRLQMVESARIKSIFKETVDTFEKKVELDKKKYDTDFRHATEINDKMKSAAFDKDQRIGISMNKQLKATETLRKQKIETFNTDFRHAKEIDKVRNIASRAQSRRDTLMWNNAKRMNVIDKMSRSEGIKVSAENMPGAMRKANVGVAESGKWIDTISKKELGLNDVQLKLNRTTDTFNMNWLGIMFAGMGVQKAFDGVQQSAMAAQGVTEDWSYVMADLFEPNATKASWAVEKLGNHVENMGPLGKTFYNTIAGLGSVLGRITFGVGQFMLGLHSIRQEGPHIVKWLGDSKTRVLELGSSFINKLTPGMLKQNKALKKQTKLNKKHTLSLKRMAVASLGASVAMMALGASANASSGLMEDVGDKVDYVTNDVYDNVKSKLGGSSILALAVFAGVTAAIIVAVQGLLAYTASIVTASAVTTAFGGVVATLTSPIWATVGAILAVVAVVALVGIAIYKNFDKIKTVFSNIGKGARDASLGMAIWFMNGITWTIDSFWGLWDSIKSVWDSVSDSVSEVWTWIMGYIQPVIDWIVKYVWGGIKYIVKGFMNLPATVKAVWDSIWASIGRVVDWIVNVVSNGITWIVGVFKGMPTAIGIAWDAIKERALLRFGQLATYIGEKKDDIVKWFEELPTNLKTVWDSIKTYATEKFDDIKTYLKDIVTNMTKDLDFTSIIGFGKTLMQKVAKGITDNKELISNALSQVPYIGGALSWIVEKVIPNTPDTNTDLQNVWEGTKLASGGVVNRPTLAMIGERGPEAVIPLNSNNKNIGGSVVYSPTITINATINNDMDIDDITRKVNENLYNETRRQGIR